MANYLPDHNRFKLSGPPAWWLRKLWDFDNSLVVVPSRQDCVYRLAQRRKLNLPAHLVNDLLFKESDTQMLASYGLVPVTTIIATANWANPFMFEDLAQRAPWRQGGAEVFNKRLEEQDQKEDLFKRQQNDDLQTYLAKDGWKLYLKKIGLRSQMWSPTTKSDSAPTPNKAPGIILGRR